MSIVLSGTGTGILGRLAAAPWSDTTPACHRLVQRVPSDRGPCCHVRPEFEPRSAIGGTEPVQGSSERPVVVPVRGWLSVGEGCRGEHSLDLGGFLIDVGST